MTEPRVGEGMAGEEGVVGAGQELVVNANLTLAVLDGASYDKATRWPAGFYAPPDRIRIEE